VYGPALIDGVLDLLLDGATGLVDFGLAERVTEAGLARLIAFAADRDPALVRESGVPVAAGAVGRSYLPPLECMIERFVHDRRRRRIADVTVSEFEENAAE
jgi:hypothetical protein